MSVRPSDIPDNGMLGKAFENQPEPGIDHVVEAASDIAKRITDAETLNDLDPKTQLLNYPAFRRRAIEIISKGEIPEGRKPFYSLLLGDLDDFKVLNTALGYQRTDDTALLPVAKIFRESVSRKGDTVGENHLLSHESDTPVSRFGGEEFLILLEGTDEEGAKIIAERVQHKVNELHPLGPDKPLGMSIGLVTFPPGSDFEEMFERANAAASEAKKIEGKNQIIAFEDLAT